MVIYAIWWDVRPEKMETYPQWAQSAIKRTLSVPGPVEFRAYRPTTGSSQVVVTYEFPDMAAWAAWQLDKETQRVLDELRTMATNVTLELWGPSPLVQTPVRPGN